MEKWFTTSYINVLAICLTAIGIYIAILVLTRISGKRSFSKMSSFDFAMTVAIGSIVASTILGASVSLAEGIVGMTAVYALQISAAALRRFEWAQKILDNRPVLLMDGSKVLKDNLKKCHVTEADLFYKLREANVTKISQVRAVVFETTGDISVLHSTDPELVLENELLKGTMR